MKTIPMYTIHAYDFQNEKALGMLTANSVHTVGLGREVLADIKGIFGGKSSLIEKKIQDIVDAAKVDFMKQVDLQYPNATSIIGYTVRLSESFIENETISYAKGAFDIAKGVASFFGGEEKDKKDGGGEEAIWTPVFIATVTGTVIGPS